MVLCYHGVRQSFEPGISSVAAGSIAAQLDYFAGLGWVYSDRTTTVLPESSLAVTLDDALEAQIENWTPILGTRNLKATLFVPAGCVGAKATWDYFARDRRHASWSQLLEWCKAGHAVGSHGSLHRDLRPLTDPELEREVGGSRKLLEDRLGVPVTEFAYPFGRFDGRVMEAVRRAGYRSAYTSSPEARGDDPLGRPRLVASCLDTPLSLAHRALATPWGRIERGKQRIISFWAGGTPLSQTWSHRVETDAA